MGYGNVDLGNVKMWINMAYSDVANRRRWSWLQSRQSVNVTSGKRIYSLPTLDLMGTTTTTGSTSTPAISNTDWWAIGDVAYFYDSTNTTLRGSSPVTAVGSNFLTISPSQTLTSGDLVYRGGWGVDNPIYFGRLRPATANNQPEPRFIDYRKMTPDYHRAYVDPTATGIPSAYTIWQNKLEIFPWPDTTYTFELYYWTGVSDLVNDTDRPLIPAQFRDILVWGALMHAADRDRDEGLRNARGAEFDKLLHVMEAAEEFSQQETILKAEMPGHYYGTFDSPSTGGVFPRV